MLVIATLSWKLVSGILFPVTHTPEETFQVDVAQGCLDPQMVNSLSGEEIKIHSPYGYELYGSYISNDNADKTVIISHDITQNAIHSLRYMLPFFNRGFNVLLIEHRDHGRSGGTNTVLDIMKKTI